MKNIIPLGNRLLCKRKKIGEKLGSGLIFAADTTAERSTDLAEVMYMPENTFADEKLINNAENIINSLTGKAENGDPDALKALLDFNNFLKIKSLKPGDEIFLSKYVGIDFHDTENSAALTITNFDDIIGIVRQR